MSGICGGMADKILLQFFCLEMQDFCGKLYKPFLSNINCNALWLGCTLKPYQLFAMIQNRSSPHLWAAKYIQLWLLHVCRLGPFHLWHVQLCTWFSTPGWHPNMFPRVHPHLWQLLTDKWHLLQVDSDCSVGNCVSPGSCSCAAARAAAAAAARAAAAAAARAAAPPPPASPPPPALPCPVSSDYGGKS